MRDDRRQRRKTMEREKSQKEQRKKRDGYNQRHYTAECVSLLLYNVRVLGEEQVDVRLHDRLPRRGAGVRVALE